MPDLVRPKRDPRKVRHRAPAVVVAALAMGVAANLVDPRTCGAIAAPEEYADLPLEALGQIVVTSVARREQSLAKAPASVYVITREQIRRYGATTLAEALRLAPNLQVARADANQYAITARGFNLVLANKMLVRVDGRPVYSPLFSGVFWEAQDVLLEDVERIEVISGPGGATWGANAVNGVINVITRHARETHGLMAAGRAGTQTSSGKLRLGGSLAGGDGRVYGKFVDQQSTARADETELGDASQHWLAGFRGDWDDTLTSVSVRGGTFRNDIDQAIDERVVEDRYLFGRLRRQFGKVHSVNLWGSYDRSERDQPGAIQEELDTYEINLQHEIEVPYQHHLVWGAGYRYQDDQVENLNPAALAFIPASRILRTVALFAQDEMRVSRKADVTVGLRLEHNEYTDWEFLPTLRFAWRPHENSLLWGAVSRAVRAPSRVDHELFSPGVPPHLFLAGGPSFTSEIANVAEAGWRDQISTKVSYSLTAFVSDYDRLRSLEPSPAGPVFENEIEGTIHGLEAWGTWRVREWWRLDAGIVGQKKALRSDPDSQDPSEGSLLGNDPEYWMNVHAGFDIARRYELDLFLRHVGALSSPEVPQYTALDARFGVDVHQNVHVAVAGQNLIEERHPEWGVAPGRPEFERSVYAEVKLRFWGVD